ARGIRASSGRSPDLPLDGSRSEASCRGMSNVDDRSAMKRSSNRATTAVAHAFLEIAYHLIGREQTYQDLEYDYFDRLDRERVRGRLMARLERLGFEVRLAQQV